MDTNKLAKFCSAIVDNGYAADLQRACARFEITDGKRAYRFLGQCGHESAGFTRLEENLNYTHAERLALIFRKHFDLDRDGKISEKELANAERYCRNPEALANKLYANRMGNRDEASGYGWLYRGRGIIQLTGQHNYQRCSLALYNDERLLDKPDILLSSEGACLSAAWFWNSNGCNELADAGNDDAITERIHGGSATKDPSYGDRMQWRDRAKECGL